MIILWLVLDILVKSRNYINRYWFLLSRSEVVVDELPEQRGNLSKFERWKQNWMCVQYCYSLGS